MKKLLFYACIAVVLASCGQKPGVFENGSSAEQWELIQDYIVPDAPVSNQRPLPNVLSEQEILLKAADYLDKEGAFDPSYFEYQNNPALLMAKIETPVLIINAESGEPSSYMLTAVDDDGVFLAQMSFNSTVNASDEEFARLRGSALPNTAYHVITKREAAELIQSQFPDSIVSEPMAITNLRLDDDPSSHMFFFWYFTVSGNERSAAGGSGDDYIIATYIPNYPSIPGGVSNRSAIDYAGQRGDHHLKGYRMAKLSKPLRLFDKLETARSAGGASFAPSNYPAESVGITPVPLK
jgi:hypothetical protein